MGLNMKLSNLTLDSSRETETPAKPSVRDNTKPAFTPLRAPIPHEKRVRVAIAPERRTMILDRVHPRDFREIGLIYCCEQCSYYNMNTRRCAMGFKVEKHQRESQLKLYNLTGKMAICRSQEID